VYLSIESKKPGDSDLFAQLKLILIIDGRATNKLLIFNVNHSGSINLVQLAKGSTTRRANVANLDESLLEDYILDFLDKAVAAS
jgi:hypothetical protein